MRLNCQTSRDGEGGDGGCANVCIYVFRENNRKTLVVMVRARGWLFSHREIAFQGSLSLSRSRSVGLSRSLSLSLD